MESRRRIRRDRPDAAFAAHTVIKATLMRITLHAVDADDYPAFQHAMVSSLRASRLNDRRFTQTGMSVVDADALVPDLLAFAARPRTKAEVEAWLEARLGTPVPRAWWALRTFAPVVHAATGGPWSHGPRPAYVTARTRPPTGNPAESVQRLVRRYLEGFGPASAQDVAQFTILRRPVVRQALDAMAGSRPKQRRSSPFARTATRGCTAGTPAGGTRCPPPMSVCCPADRADRGRTRNPRRHPAPTLIEADPFSFLLAPGDPDGSPARARKP